ncbi:hypothetical protein BB559_003214 [Furculomyces boomerangus]|uniref:Plasma membrane proteolipid 3 n=1 Tax=Furculomyces boomerangus TaxID=61424 RepID=A0A2T9YMN1_9FUNG|nr:hypothetical protein BB559_003214 [Furculomyces boomerangus]
MSSVVVVSVPSEERVVVHSSCPGTCCQGVSSLIFPPLGVLLKRGCSADFIINIALTSLGYFPGLIHACYLIGREDHDYQEIRGSSPQVVYAVSPVHPQSEAQQTLLPPKDSVQAQEPASGNPPPYSPK